MAKKLLFVEWQTRKNYAVFTGRCRLKCMQIMLSRTQSRQSTEGIAGEKINQTMCHSRCRLGQKKSHFLWVFPSYEQVTCCADNIAIYFSQILYVACRPGKNESGSVGTLLRTESTDGSRKEMTQCCNKSMK